MKTVLFFAFIITLVSCSNSANVPMQGETQGSDSGIYYAYSPLYTGGYTPGSYKNVKTVTDVWKQFENGDITKSASSFADDVTFIYPDQTIAGKRDSVLTQIKKMRDNYTAVQSFVSSWLPAKAKDRDEDWVFIWGKQQLTDKGGKLKSVEIHEIWKLNKEGKIVFMQQYQTATN